MGSREEGLCSEGMKEVERSKSVAISSHDQLFSDNVENFYMGVAIEWWLQSRRPGGAPGDQLRGTLVRGLA